MKFLMAPLLAGFVLVIGGCSTSSSTSSGGGTDKSAAGSSDAKPLVAFAQANSADPWRRVFDADAKSEAEKHASDFTFEEQTAEDDANKQIGQIETLLLKQPKVLLVSPATEAVESATSKAFDAGIPVVLLDRAVPGEKYTCLVGGDNVQIGHAAAAYLAKSLKGKGIVLMIQGLGGATATTDRKRGAMDEFKKYPGISVIEGDDCKYQRQAAHSYMETFLQGRKPFDAVYAHNDEMAIGAYTAWETWSKSQPSAKKPIFVGIDGCQQETIEMIKAGKLDATFKYPVPGGKGVQIAASLIRGDKVTQKRVVLDTEEVTKANADAYLAANPNLAK
jgi:ribose transport system substrate-binding protein